MDAEQGQQLQQQEVASSFLNAGPASSVSGHTASRGSSKGVASSSCVCLDLEMVSFEVTLQHGSDSYLEATSSKRTGAALEAVSSEGSASDSKELTPLGESPGGFLQSPGEGMPRGSQTESAATTSSRRQARGGLFWVRGGFLSTKTEHRAGQ